MRFFLLVNYAFWDLIKESVRELGISKLDAAKRQLEMAILLFFNQSDPVSIHTLIAAAHAVLLVLGQESGIKSSIFPSLKHISKKLRDKWYRKTKEAQNFFKHASRDKEQLFKFNLEYNELFILDACLMYEELTQERTALIQLFYIWHAAAHPELEQPIKFTEAIRDITSSFSINQRSPRMSYLALLPELSKSIHWINQAIKNASIY